MTYVITIVLLSLLCANDKAVLPEKPAIIQTMRLTHADGGSAVVTAASFRNEKISHSLKGQARGFPSRNWFFFGGIDTVMTKQVIMVMMSDIDGQELSCR